MYYSIEELNRKIWYRLLKVVYFLALILVISITVLISWGDAHPFDPAAYGAIPMNINQLNPSDYTVNNTPAGFVPDQQLSPAQNAPTSYPVGQAPWEKQSAGSSGTNHGFSQFFSEAIPALLIEVLLFEIIRRSFYYVVIGRVFPRARGNPPNLKN